jgi:hypothetical protein
MEQSSGEEPAHDILAAEAFAVPTPDPSLRQRPVELPEDPSGIAEPHDILAAEEFAMPAVQPAERQSLARRAKSSRPVWAAIAAGVLGALRAVRRARRR